MSNQRFIIEYGLQGRVRDAVGGYNTYLDLTAYLNRNNAPHKGYRLITCQLLSDGNFLLVWERINYESKAKQK